MILDYLTQRATWRRIFSRDSRTGEPDYAESEIPVRWSFQRELVRDREGQEVVSEAVVYTVAAVDAGDELVDERGRAWTVLQVAEKRDVAGGFSHREVRL